MNELDSSANDSGPHTSIQRLMAFEKVFTDLKDQGGKLPPALLLSLTHEYNCVLRDLWRNIMQRCDITNGRFEAGDAGGKGSEPRLPGGEDPTTASHVRLLVRLQAIIKECVDILNAENGHNSEKFTTHAASQLESSSSECTIIDELAVLKFLK